MDRKGIRCDSPKKSTSLSGTTDDFYDYNCDLDSETSISGDSPQLSPSECSSAIGCNNAAAPSDSLATGLEEMVVGEIHDGAAVGARISSGIHFGHPAFLSLSQSSPQIARSEMFSSEQTTDGVRDRRTVHDKYTTLIMCNRNLGKRSIEGEEAVTERGQGDVNQVRESGCCDRNIVPSAPHDATSLSESSVVVPASASSMAAMAVAPIPVLGTINDGTADKARMMNSIPSGTISAGANARRGPLHSSQKRKSILIETGGESAPSERQSKSRSKEQKVSDLHRLISRLNDSKTLSSSCSRPPTREHHLPLEIVQGGVEADVGGDVEGVRGDEPFLIDRIKSLLRERKIQAQKEMNAIIEIEREFTTCLREIDPLCPSSSSSLSSSSTAPHLYMISTRISGERDLKSPQSPGGSSSFIVRRRHSIFTTRSSKTTSLTPTPTRVPPPTQLRAHAYESMELQRVRDVSEVLPDTAWDRAPAEPVESDASTAATARAGCSMEYRIVTLSVAGQVTGSRLVGQPHNKAIKQSMQGRVHLLNKVLSQMNRKKAKASAQASLSACENAGVPVRGRVGLGSGLGSGLGVHCGVEVSVSVGVAAGMGMGTNMCDDDADDAGCVSPDVPAAQAMRKRGRPLKVNTYHTHSSASTVLGSGTLGENRGEGKKVVEEKECSDQNRDSDNDGFGGIEKGINISTGKSHMKKVAVVLPTRALTSPSSSSSSSSSSSLSLLRRSSVRVSASGGNSTIGSTSTSKKSQQPLPVPMHVPIPMPVSSTLRFDGTETRTSTTKTKTTESVSVSLVGTARAAASVTGTARAGCSMEYGIVTVSVAGQVTGSRLVGQPHINDTRRQGSFVKMITSQIHACAASHTGTIARTVNGSGSSRENEGKVKGEGNVYSGQNAGVDRYDEDDLVGGVEQGEEAQAHHSVTASSTNTISSTNSGTSTVSGIERDVLTARSQAMRVAQVGRKMDEIIKESKRKGDVEVNASAGTIVSTSTSTLLLVPVSSRLRSKSSEGAGGKSMLDMEWERELETERAIIIEWDTDEKNETPKALSDTAIDIQLGSGTLRENGGKGNEYSDRNIVLSTRALTSPSSSSSSSSSLSSSSSQLRRPPARVIQSGSGSAGTIVSTSTSTLLLVPVSSRLSSKSSEGAGQRELTKHTSMLRKPR